MKSTSILTAILTWILATHLCASPPCKLSDLGCKECDEAIDAMAPQEHRAERIKKVILLAELGHQYSQAQLTAFYALGVGTEVNEAKEAKWDLRLAESGIALSQGNIGEKYLSGRGVEKDEQEGIKWMKKAAMQGEARAEYAMGNACLNGVAMDKDPVEAVRWYRKSVVQSYIPALVALAKCYSSGSGVNQDLVVAYQYFDIASTMGKNKEAEKERDSIADKMTDTQVAEARAMSAEWQLELMNANKLPGIK